MTKEKALQVIHSYLRAAVAAALAMYLAGETDPKKLAYAALAAVAAPAMKAFDKSAKEFGLGSKPVAKKKVAKKR
jgi:hypothetical protein